MQLYNSSRKSHSSDDVAEEIHDTLNMVCIGHCQSSEKQEEQNYVETPKGGTITTLYYTKEIIICLTRLKKTSHYRKKISWILENKCAENFQVGPKRIKMGGKKG